MHARRRGLTVLELVILLIVIVVVAVLLLRMRGGESAPPPTAVDSSGVLAPPGAGNELTTRLAVVAPLDTTALAGDTVTVRLRATTETGTAVARATIQLAVTAGGGQLSATTAVTADNGEIEVRWVLGSEAGPQTVRATVQGNEAATATVTVSAVARPAGAP
ncbi:MAG: hypothetical protein ACYC2G_09295 [Gemmatimonadaceae bacterium]